MQDIPSILFLLLLWDFSYMYDTFFDTAYSPWLTDSIFFFILCILVWIVFIDLYASLLSLSSAAFSHLLRHSNEDIFHIW